MEEAFLQLVRFGIGHSAYLTPERVLDWDAIEALAIQHGLLGVIVDGIDNLREEQ